MNEFGRALRRWRRLRGVKQSHAAELFGVTQGTLSRWERGHHHPPDEVTEQLSHLLAAPVDSAADAGLRRLVESSTLSVHLICDLTHRLIAASPPRYAEWRVDAAELRGQSLWRFASDEIRSAESRLGELGWYDDRVARFSFWTSTNASPRVTINPGTLIWERLALSDGTLARLVTSPLPARADFSDGESAG
jgi:transcriptional regulator with XRE-family HTH domain